VRGCRSKRSYTPPVGDNRHESAPGILSPSQINTFAECERKWGWTYLEGLRGPPTGSAALGSATHAQLENYLRGEELDFTAPNNVAEIAATGVHLLPGPNAPGLEIEKAFKFQSSATGIWYRGFVDAAVDPDHREGPDRGVPLIIDHKTTSDLKWRKTESDLQRDVQAIIYAKNALIRWPECTEVDLRWVYYQTRGRRIAVPTEVTLTRDHVEAVFEKIEETSQLIQLRLKAKPPVLDLTPNPKACNSYGGCPFRARCNLGPEGMFKSINTDRKKTMGLLDKQKPLDTVTEIVTVTVGDPAVSAGSTVYINPFPPTDQPVNPPEYQPPPPSGPAAVQPPEPAAGANGPGEPPPTATPSRRGRPKGSKNKPSAEERTAELPFEQVAADDGVEAVSEVSWTLYVDCRPEGRTVTNADVLIAFVQDEMRKEFGCEDYRVGEKVAFGQGAGYLSLGVSRLAAEQKRDLYLDTRTPEGAVVKSALVSVAPNVVASVR
jgi:hypothetical protein